MFALHNNLYGIRMTFSAVSQTLRSYQGNAVITCEKLDISMQNIGIN